MKWLKAKCGTRFRVDDDTYQWARECKWYLKEGYPCRYVTSTRHGTRDNYEAYLHREIMHFPIGFVHHKDENPLNCQKENLEVLSPAAHLALHEHGEKTRQRIRQAGPRSASGFKGVSWHKLQQRWIAQLCVGGKNHQLGYADDPEEAALRYDAAVIAFIGKGAYTNLIPNEDREPARRGEGEG